MTSLLLGLQQRTLAKRLHHELLARLLFVRNGTFAKLTPEAQARPSD
jgi:hypothetical protein